jgi:hypothetical protein
MAQTIDQQLELAAREGVIFLVKALRGAIRMDQTENRALLNAATSAVGNYTRNRATTSAMQQTRLITARMLADAETGPKIAGLLASGQDDGV